MLARFSGHVYFTAKWKEIQQMQGWVKLPREILVWRWYTDIPCKTVYFHLILTAGFEVRQWQNVTIKPGQTVTTVKKLATDTGLTEAQIRTALKKLEFDKKITIKTTNKFTIITLVDYDVLEAPKKENSKQNSKQNNNQITNKSQTNRKPTYLYKNDKNVKNDKNNKNNTLAQNDDAFEIFWAEYPRKVGKKAAKEAFNKAIKKVNIETLVAAVKQQKCWSQWTRNGGQYIPHPKTWLNQERWEDDVEERCGTYENTVQRQADSGSKWNLQTDTLDD